jgi:hypothetical protein
VEEPLSVETRLEQRLSFSSVVLTLVLLAAGCGAWMGGRQVAVGESFKLSPGEKASIIGAALSVQLSGVRRTWYVDGKRETAEADIIITLNGTEQRQWMGVGEKVMAGNYLVNLRGADPFGKTNCELMVLRR